MNIGDSVIGESVTVKNLGVTFDRFMTFDQHVAGLVRRCTGTLLALHHAKHGVPPEILPALIDGLVMSCIRYCIAVSLGVERGHFTDLLKLLPPSGEASNLALLVTRGDKSVMVLKRRQETKKNIYNKFYKCYANLIP